MRYYEQSGKSARVLPLVLTALSLIYLVFSITTLRVVDIVIASLLFILFVFFSLLGFATVTITETGISCRQFLVKREIRYEQIDRWGEKTIHAGGGSLQMLEIRALPTQPGRKPQCFTLITRRELEKCLRHNAADRHQTAEHVN